MTSITRSQPSRPQPSRHQSARSRPGTVLLLSATEFEAAPLTTGLTPAEPLGRGSTWCVRHGQVDGVPLSAVACGVGKVNAAAAALLSLELLQPSAVLLLGIGGAYQGSGLELGAVALAASETHLDSGVGHGAAWQSMEQLGFPLLPGDPPTYNRFDLTSAALELVAAELELTPLPFGSAEAVTADPALARLLRSRHGVAVESMEGAAVAQVAAAYGVTLIELRGVSNVVAQRDKSQWRLQAAVDSSCAAARRALLPLSAAATAREKIAEDRA